jgi:hypothetical protein
MAKIDTLDALDTANADPANESDAAHPETPPAVSASGTKTQGEPAALPTDEKTGGAVDRVDNRSAWYRALGLAEPMMGALASSPGIQRRRKKNK